MASRLTLQEFIDRSNYKHQFKYDYSKSEYVNSRQCLIIICKVHGEFQQKPYIHLDGSGCQKCDPTRKLSNSTFIERSVLIHGSTYDYSSVEYGKNNYDLVSIVCKKHGAFTQRPWAHLRGQGCPKCSDNQKSNNDKFIEKSIKKHGNTYDYSSVEYVNKRSKVKIICTKHGIFEQRPYVHIQGHGCSICRNSKLEKYLRDRLISLNIKFEQNKRYDDCRNILPLPFDFYLVDHNVLLECDGVQHHRSIDFFGGDNRFECQTRNDDIKNKYCEDRNIKLIRLKNLDEIDRLDLSVIYRNTI